MDGLNVATAHSEFYVASYRERCEQMGLGTSDFQGTCLRRHINHNPPLLVLICLNSAIAALVRIGLLGLIVFESKFAVSPHSRPEPPESSSFLLLVVMPGATSSFLLLLAMPLVTRSFSNT